MSQIFLHCRWIAEQPTSLTIWLLRCWREAKESIAVLFPLPQNVHGSVFSRENAPVAVLAADRKRFLWAAWTVMKNCRSPFAWACAHAAERERNPSGCRVSGVTHYSYWSTWCWFRRCWFRRCWFRHATGFSVVSSSGAGISAFLFPGLPSEISSSPAALEKALDFTHAGHCIAQSTLLLSRLKLFTRVNNSMRERISRVCRRGVLGPRHRIMQQCSKGGPLLALCFGIARVRDHAL